MKLPSEMNFVKKDSFMTMGAMMSLEVGEELGNLGLHSRDSVTEP